MPMAGMDPMTRRRAKAINFGIIYGISAFGLARQLGIAPGEARAYIDAYFARYPGIRDYMERDQGGGPQRTGYVTTPFGRRCWMPGIADKNPARRGLCRAAGDQRPAAGRRGRHHQARHGPPARGAGARRASTARMLLQVHDELLFEAPAAEADATAAAGAAR